MQNQLRFLTTASVILLGSLALNAQIVTTNTLTPTQLVQNVLLGPGVTATNITYTGYANAIGRFDFGNLGVPGLGIDSGVVMSTGTILANDPTFGPGLGPQGPNNSTGAGCDNGTPGDPDLTAIANAATFNAAILEFDFVPMADTVKFRYVFGTEEYMEYVAGGYADVFGFFLTGVSVVLPTTNIALIPMTTTPVTALNVNANVNPQYYVSNENPQGTSIQYDGFTTVLIATYPVECGETYHIKLAVADALDGILDAGVFLEAGSFTVGTVDLQSQISYGSNNDSTLFEGCGQACLILSRTGSTTLADTVAVVIGGTAVNGVDFIPQIPGQFIFQAGMDSIVICIQAVQDNVAEGLETLTLSTTVNGPCIQSVNSLTLYMSDFQNITVDAGPDTALCSSSPIAINTIVTGGVEPHNYLWNTGATSTSIVVLPTQTTSYIITVTDNCGTPIGLDTVTVFLPDVAPLSLSASPDLELCTNDPALMTVQAGGGSMPYQYNWTTIFGPDQVPDSTGTVNQFTPTGSGTFLITVREGCGDLDSAMIRITVEVCEVSVPNVFTPNGDGTNDALVFGGLENFPGSGLIIYNRWGAKVYENADYQNNWAPADLVDGTYYYILTVTGMPVLTGFVTLLTSR